MNKIFTISWREFKSIVLTKSYLVSIFLVPVVVFATIVVAFSLQFVNLVTKPDLPVAIVDRTDKLTEYIVNNRTDKTTELNFQIYSHSKQDAKKYSKELKKLKVGWRKTKELNEQKLKEQIKQQKLEALLIIPKNFFEENKVEYISRNNLLGTLPRMEKQMLKAFRLKKLRQESNLSREQINKLLQPIKVKSSSIIVADKKDQGKDSTSLRLLAAIAIYGILSICIAVHGSKLTMSILEERKSKIMEVLLSAVKPIEFMWGKIIGSAAAAILQTGIWSAVLFFAFVRSGAVVFDVTARVITQVGEADASLNPEAGTTLVSNTVNETANIGMLDNPQISLNPEMLLYLVIFTVTGFLLYATLFAAVGAIANSVTEAQYLETPLVFLMMFPTYLFLPLVENPNGPVIVGSSFFPYFTPFVMYSRICVDQVPFLQILLSLTLLVLAIAINVFLVSALYKTGLLLYGKKVNFKELIQLLRYSFKL